MLAADVMPSVADRVMQLIRDWEIDDGRLPAHPPGGGRPESRRTEGSRERQEFAWIEVMGEARSHSRPLGRYLALMSVAGVLGAIGVITDNPILIVGAMAVSPDILPICAACVGIVAGRLRLARRAHRDAAARNPAHLGGRGGNRLGAAGGAASSPGDFQVHDTSLHGLAHIDYSTILVALAAGVAAMLSFETRAASAVGVAISVTTIPASALFGVSLGLGEVSVSWGAAGVLAVNVSPAAAVGHHDPAVQRWLGSRGRPPPA